MNRLNRRQMLGTAGAVAASVLIRPGVAGESRRPQLDLSVDPGLILPPGPAGHWDSERTSCPRVLRLPDGRWLMSYYGRDPEFERAINLPSGRSGMAVSADGIHWERLRGPGVMGAVLDPAGDAERFDSGHVGITDIQHHRDGYRAWYVAGSRSQSIQVGASSYQGFPLRPGLATSKDLLNWQKVDGPFKGAMLDIGAPGEFDALLVGWPQELRDDDGTSRLYYHTLHRTEGFMICLAVSIDDVHWEKIGPIMGRGEQGSFDERGVATRQVIRQGSEYLMFYEGMYGQASSSIGMARSDDGIHWTRIRGSEDRGAIFAHSPADSGLWDAQGVGTPWVIANEAGGFNLYYVGANAIADMPASGVDELAHVHQIGLAISEGQDLTRWRRWSADS
jgi:hypothetical protein